MTDSELKNCLLQKYYDKRVVSEFVILQPKDFEFEISEREILRITKLLIEDKFIDAEVGNYMDGQLFLKKLPCITNKGIEYIEAKNIQEVRPMGKIKLFISHSSEDAELISKLVILLQACIKNFNDDDIRCSSLPGYGFNSGENFYESIREESQSCNLILSVFSKNALNSKIFLIESGIGWALKKIIPVIIEKDFEYDNLPKPFDNLITKKLTCAEGILEIIHIISKKINLELNNAAKINYLVDNHINNNNK